MAIARRIAIVAASADMRSAHQLQWKLRQAGFPEAIILDEYSISHPDIAEHLWRIANDADTHLVLLSHAAEASSTMHAVFVSDARWQAEAPSRRSLYLLMLATEAGERVPKPLAGYERYDIAGSFEGAQWEALLRTLRGVSEVPSDQAQAIEEGAETLALEWELSEMETTGAHPAMPAPEPEAEPPAQAEPATPPTPSAPEIPDWFNEAMKDPSKPVVRGDAAPPLPPGEPAPGVPETPDAAPQQAPAAPPAAPAPAAPVAPQMPPPPAPGYGEQVGSLPSRRPTGAPQASASDSPAPATATKLEYATFTAYHPKEVPLRAWQPMLVFISIDTPAALARIDAAVTERFGARRERYRGAQATEPAALRRGVKLTIVPEIPGFRSNPAEMTITWDDDVQQHEFQIRAETAAPGTSVNGQITVYAGPIIRGVIPVSLYVEQPRERPGTPEEFASAAARAYRHVFVSYAHRDMAVVRSCEAAAQSLGDEYLRDVRILRSGQDFDERLLDKIRDADLFQLFWSPNAARSQWVRREWEFALSLLAARESFVRPVYWSKQPYDIPSELAPLHFQRLDLARLGWGRLRVLMYQALGG